MGNGTTVNKKVKHTFRSLRYRNFRLFFFGQSISLIGTWVQRIAAPWLVYTMTDSAFMLGFVGFVGQLPTLLISPLAGVVSDKYNKHKMLLITQIALMIQAFLLAILAFSDDIQIWQIIILVMLHGIFNAFDVPVRQSLVVELVEDKEDISNAIALNSTIFNGAKLVGPSLAGILITVTSIGVCFLINAVSFLFVIASILMMREVPHVKKEVKSGMVSNLKEGWNYTFGFPPIRNVILLLISVNLFGIMFILLMPVIAKEQLAGDSATFGMLMASSGVGAMIAAIYLASRKTVKGLARMIYKAISICGVALLLLAYSTNAYISSVLMVIAGFGMMLSTASGNSVIQTLADDDKRGRVMSYYSLAFLGTAPIAAIISGWAADLIGVDNTIMLSGVIVLITGFLFWWDYKNIKGLIIETYKQKGIISKEPNA